MSEASLAESTVSLLPEERPQIPSLEKYSHYLKIFTSVFAILLDITTVILFYAYYMGNPKDCPFVLVNPMEDGNSSNTQDYKNTGSETSNTASAITCFIGILISNYIPRLTQLTHSIRRIKGVYVDSNLIKFYDYVTIFSILNCGIVWYFFQGYPYETCVDLQYETFQVLSPKGMIIFAILNQIQLIIASICIFVSYRGGKEYLLNRPLLRVVKCNTIVLYLFFKIWVKLFICCCTHKDNQGNHYLNDQHSADSENCIILFVLVTFVFLAILYVQALHILFLKVYFIYIALHVMEVISVSYFVLKKE